MRAKQNHVFILLVLGSHSACPGEHINEVGFDSTSNTNWGLEVREEAREGLGKMQAFVWMQDLGRSTGGKIISLLLALAMIFSYSNIFVYSAKAFANENVTTETQTDGDQPEKKTDEGTENDNQNEGTETQNVTSGTETKPGNTTNGGTETTTDPSTNGNGEDDQDENTEGDQSETSTEPYVFDEATGTLTITGVDTVSRTSVEVYLSGLGFNPSSVTSLVINNVTTIDGGAFSGYSKLVNATLNDVQNFADNEVDYYKQAKSNAFKNCSSLQTVTLNKVGYVGREAFNGCKNISTLTCNNVNTIGVSCFSSCSALTILSLDGVQIRNTAFLNCPNLTTLTIKNSSIGENAFSGCNKLKSLTLDNISSIGTRAFSSYGSNFKACIELNDLTMENIGTIGNYAFSGCSSIEEINFKSVGTIGQYAFSECSSIKEIEFESVNTIGNYAFYKCTGLETVKIKTVDIIGNGAFWNCSNLSSIASLKNVKDRIGGFAFRGCSKLVDLLTELVKDKDFAAKLGYNGNYGDIMERIIAILNGQFVLDDAGEIKQISGLEGWDNTTENRDAKWNTYENGTQIIQQARWANEDSTIAEVKVDAYFTAQQQMDYIFVADLSASMAYLGNANDQNARFYDMQSKLYNMVSQLMDTDGYDCNVSIVTFGGYFSGKATVESETFTNVKAALEYIEGLEPLNENTDYKLGLNKTLELLQAPNHDSARSTSVVFLSDGRPTRDGTKELKTTEPETLDTYNKDISEIASQIKGIDNVNIYGILHSPTTTEQDWAQKAMSAVCSTYWQSTDTKSFGEAMNKAFMAVYPTYTITIPVGNDFQIDNIDEIATSAGSGNAYYDEASNSIVWTMDEATPFTKHTLTFFESLKEDRQTIAGTVDFLNNGAGPDGQGASITADGKLINSIKSTILSRTYIPQVIPTPNPGTDTTTTTTTTVVAPAAPAALAAPAGPAAPAAADATPIADDPLPMAGPTQENISDDETPMASVYDEPHCWVHILMIIGMIITAIYGAAVAIRRSSNNRNMGELERDLTEEREISYSSSHARNHA